MRYTVDLYASYVPSLNIQEYSAKYFNLDEWDSITQSN